MMIDLPLTVGFRHERVLGRVKLDEELEQALASGETFTLSANITRGKEGNKLIGLTLIPMNHVPKRTGW